MRRRSGLALRATPVTRHSTHQTAVVPRARLGLRGSIQSATVLAQTVGIALAMLFLAASPVITTHLARACATPIGVVQTAALAPRSTTLPLTAMSAPMGMFPSQTAIGCARLHWTVMAML